MNIILIAILYRSGTKKMEYKGKQWHEKCFSCCVCKKPFGTKSFVPKKNDVYCSPCYDDKFASRCAKCSKVKTIKSSLYFPLYLNVPYFQIITTGGVKYEEKSYHRECFTCGHCSKVLAGQSFTSKDDKPYCADCYGNLFAKKCTGCHKAITGWALSNLFKILYSRRRRHKFFSADRHWQQHKVRHVRG